MAKKTRKKPGKAKSTKAKSKQAPAPPKLPGAWQLTKAAWQVLWQHKKLFIGITLIYGVLSMSLVEGLAGGADLTSLKNALSHASQGGLDSIASSLSVFTVLIGSVGNGSGQAAETF